MPLQYHALILGHGDCARRLADHLSSRHLDVALADAAPCDANLKPENDKPENVKTDQSGTYLSGACLMDCQGQAGAFQVTMNQAGRHTKFQVGSIVVAEQACHTPNFDAYGLKPSQRVLAISEAEAVLNREGFTVEANTTRVLFLNDWTEQCHPVTAARMLRLCLTVQKRPKMSTVYLTGQLKVSEDGMEACCQAAKRAGTVFFKVDSELPRLETLPEGRIQAAWRDDSTRLGFTTTFDYVVVDEKIAASPRLSHLARVLRLDRDSHGFVQSDNIRRWSNATNRRGIFVAGEARAVLSVEAQAADADHAALKVSAFLSDLDTPQRPDLEIETGRCARCLTCYRLCPHAAIEMTPRMAIMPEACQNCGLCAAGCPNRAIQVHDDLLGPTLDRLISEETISSGAGTFMPRIVAFCCRRSAIPARDLALTSGARLPPGLLVVEGVCGGAFSMRHLLSALESGADGVMVLTCHQGNCHSEYGPQHASQRMAGAIQALKSAGIGAERFHVSTLAANMDDAFVSTIQTFAQKIIALGPVLEKSNMRRN